MLNDYVKKYMAELKAVHETLDATKQLHACVNGEYLNVDEVKSALINEIAKHYKLDKKVVTKFLVVEEVKL